MKVVASLWDVVEARTAQGGQCVTYEPLGTVWLRLGARRRREVVEQGLNRVVESLTALARHDPRLQEGQVLRFMGAEWVVTALDPEGAGRVRLALERRR